MLSYLPFFPPQGSTHAASVDALYLFFVAVTAFFSVLIALLIVVFAVRFRRRTADEVGAPIHGSLVLELTWTFIPLVIAMVMFVWGASLYFQITTPPSNAMEIYVVGKRWMWKAQHVSGQREINELHVPVGQPVKLIIGSEDVLHAYWVPAFRMKMDAVPGRTTTMWFEASKPGEYQLFCAEYCGMSHSRMIGKVTAMEPGAFQTWLAGGKATGSMAELGAKVFTDLGCATCHMDAGAGPRPVAARRLRVAGHAGQRREGHRRRGLHPRVDPDPDRQDGGRLPAADADLPGCRQRGADRPAHRLREVARRHDRHARAGPDRRRTGAAPAPGATPQAAGH